MTPHPVPPTRLRSAEWALGRAASYQCVDANAEIVIVLAAECRRLQAENEQRLADCGEWLKVVERQRALLGEAADIVETVSALLQQHNDNPQHGDDRPVFAINGATLFLGDLRRAQALLTKLRSANGKA